MEEGKRAIDRRVKLTKLADREEDGWEVVRHYEADDLAENSDDERHISKARELAASAKKRRSTDRQNKKRREQAREDRSGAQQNFSLVRDHSLASRAHLNIQNLSIQREGVIYPIRQAI